MRRLLFLLLGLSIVMGCGDGGTENVAASLDGLSAVASTFHTVPPSRVLDSRAGAAFAAGETRCIDVAKATAQNATAIVVNVTAVDPSGAGYLTLWGGPDARPATSNVNFRANETAASAALVALGEARSLCIFAGGGSAHVLVDVAGYFGADESGSSFQPAPNERLLDTRAGSLDGDLVVKVPGPRAEAVVVNLTSTNVEGGGYFTAYAADRASPPTSNLNVAPGSTRANLAFVALAADNTFKIDRRARAHLIVDLVGTFTRSGGGVVRPLAPFRAYDSRSAGGPLMPGEVRAIPMLPPGAAGTSGAVFVTVTAVDPTKTGFLTVGATSAVTSTLNFTRAQNVANLTATWVTAEGIGYVYNPFGRTHVIVDVFASVATPPAIAPPLPAIPPEPEFDRWAELLRARGYEPNPGGAATVVGVRGEARVAQVFDDTFAVLLPNEQVVTFAGSTHPWFADHSFPVDIDRDGRPDVGMIKQGRFAVTRRGSHYGAPAYIVTLPDGDPFLPGWRNTDHDDVYSAEEKASSDARGDALNEILFHAAGPGSLAPIGCQVFTTDDMNRLAELTGDTFDYVLIEP